MVAASLSRRRLRHLPLAWLARYGQNRRMATPTKHSGATPRLGVPAQPSPRRILEDGTYRPTILDLPGGERPRERMRDIGASALSNGELLAILLRTGTPAENILELAARILTRFDGLAQDLRAPAMRASASSTGSARPRLRNCWQRRSLGDEFNSLRTPNAQLSAHPRAWLIWCLAIWWTSKRSTWSVAARHQELRACCA